jgi:fluoride exporter
MPADNHRDSTPGGDALGNALPIDPDTAVEDAPPKHPRSGPRRWDIALVIAAGGAIGAAARYGLNQAWPTQPGAFPWATFTENVLGCLLIGALMVYLLEVIRPHRYARPFLAIGILGGFTTFSTYTADTNALLRDGEGPLALTYLFATLIVALFATWAGLTAARAAAAVTHPRHRRSTP